MVVFCNMLPCVLLKLQYIAAVKLVRHARGYHHDVHYDWRLSFRGMSCFLMGKMKDKTDVSHLSACYSSSRKFRVQVPAMKGTIVGENDVTNMK